MKQETDAVSVRELYQLIDQRMGQVNGSIVRLENKFDNLESGRLSVIERNVAQMQGKLMMIPILISIGMNVFFFVMNYVLNGHK